MRRLVVTMACHGAVQSYGQLTFPLIQAYAFKCNADFLVYQQLSDQWLHIGYEKFEYRKLFNPYDRILHIDADMIVRSTTPDLFKLVPQDQFAGVDEHKYASPKMETPYVNRIKELKLKEPRFYINVGLMLFNKEHASLLFGKTEEETSHFREQTHINRKLHLNGINMCLLDWRFNYMSLMENHGLPKDDAFIIHYAGRWRGLSPEDMQTRMGLDVR